MALTLKSQRQIQTDILNAIISRLGLTDVNPGSVLDLLTQAVSQEDFNQYVQMSQIARLVDLNSTTGEDLENRAFEYQITRNDAVQATGLVNIIRQLNGADYVKLTTSFISAGVLAPSQGDMALSLNSTTGFEFGGRIVIGRGLPNEEIRIIDTPNVNSDGQLLIQTPLAFDHAFTEEVTFIPAGQLDIVISAGTTVSVAATGINAQIDYEITDDQTLFAGESTLSNINVRAIEAGTLGNVGAQTISLIDLEGLRVNNESSFTTGQDLETDESLRDRIRSTIQSLSRGTQQAILNAIVGLVDPESSKRVVSANVILPQASAQTVKVFIDDGTGFEPTFSPQASETLVADATRGTSRLQLDFAPLVKAQIESANSEPFNLSAVALAPVSVGLSLTVRVGGAAGTEETINVLASDLSFASTVRAEEIVRIINNKATIFEARTSDNGTKVLVTAITDTNEDIFVARPNNVAENLDLNTYTQFTNAEQSTSYIYKNDVLLNKDGLTATVSTPSTAGPTFDLVTGSTLSLIVDGKGNNRQNINFDDSSSTTGSLSASRLAGIINEQATGVIAQTIENGSRLSIASATTLSGSSSIQVVTPNVTPARIDANLVLLFPTETVTGANRDYTLNRELGTVELTESLVAGDNITAGNAFSRATVRTPATVSSATRINAGVGFLLTFDNTGTGTFVTRNVVFADDRFSSAYLDDNINRTNNVEFGFNKITQISRLPEFVADYITKQIYPFGTAFVRTIGNNSFIEIRTNTFSSDEVQSSETSNNTNGTIQLSTLNDSTGTARLLGIWQGVILTEVNNQRPHTGFRENTVSKTFRDSPGTATAPTTTQSFTFSPTDSLVVVMNDDQTNGTFVLPLGNEDAVGTGTTSRTQFTGTNLKTVYSSDLDDTDKDYTQVSGAFTSPNNPFTGGSTTPVLPQDTQAAWTNLPADSNLLDFFVAFTGDEETTIGTVTTLEATDRNSLSTSAGDGYVIGFPTGTEASTTSILSIVNPVINVTVGRGADFAEGDTFRKSFVDVNTLVQTFNTYTVLSVAGDAVTLTGGIDGSGQPLATPTTGLDVGDVIQTVLKPRDATPVLSVSFNSTTNESIYSIGLGTAAMAGTRGQLQASDFAATGFAVGDIVTFEEMGNSVNNGTFVITDLSTSGVPLITVINQSGATEVGASGAAKIGQKRRIIGYNFIDGTVQLEGTGFRETPFAARNITGGTNAGDRFFVFANTMQNVQLQLNNSRLSSIASQAEIVNTDRGQRVQIASLMEGSAGFVEVTGGTGNNSIIFSTAANRGLQGYNYYTGLLLLVHNTIYGDDTDLITFPGIGAAGVNFQVLAPTVTEIILELDVTLQEGVSLAAVENEVNTAITGYVNGLGVGDDVIVEELRARTITINGITDVSIISLIGGDSTDTTIANIPIADNEIARVKVSDITIG